MTELPPPDRLWKDEPPRPNPPAIAEANPYAAPRDAFGLPVDPRRTPTAALERDRLDHLGRESSVKAIGTINIICGWLLTGVGLLAVVGFVIGPAQGRTPFQLSLMLAGIIMLVISGGLALTVGYLTRYLHPAGRIIATVLYALGLLLSGIGTLFGFAQRGFDGPLAINLIQIAIQVFFLWILWSEPSGMLFSRHYRHDVIPQTRHLKPPLSLILVAFLALMVVGIGVIVLVAVRTSGIGFHRPT